MAGEGAGGRRGAREGGARSVKTVFLVPRRNDGGHRDALWAWCRRRWETYFPEIPIIEGHHTDGPFNRSAAINRAAREAGDWDLGIVIDSDIFIRVSQLTQALKTAATTGKVTWAHRRWRGLHEDHTARVLGRFSRGKHRRTVIFTAEVDNEDMDILVERTNPISWSCCVVIPRPVWDDLGGFDERFVGWGMEDMAFKSLVTCLYGWERIPGDVYHLWHPRSEERIVKGQPGSTAPPEYVVNMRLGRRYMVAAYRDYGVGDDPGTVIEQELRDRHVRNLMLDDVKLMRQTHAPSPAALEWSGLWPTLEELREGAIAHRQQQARGSITVIVHTGGSAENWPQRREYLEQSLASLAANVNGPIVQRVVYDCWGSPAIRAELEALAESHGFYVAGPDGPVDFTGSMRAMWTYLGRRAKGEYIFQAEDDFVYERPVDLDQMIAVLREQPHLVQIALLRDACYADERETGGILGWPLPAFTFRDGWFEHRQFWTNNPSLFRKSMTDRPWPIGRHSETLFGRAVLADPKARAAFWGAGENWIRHVGEVRAGSGY
jgi:hypothetical protein